MYDGPLPSEADRPCRKQNDIPIFCPALTDGSLGDMLFFHSYKTATPLIIDIVADIRKINDLSMKAPKAGMIILGGGVCKHQIANSMLFVRLTETSLRLEAHQLCSAMEPTTRCMSIPARNSMVPMEVHARMKP